MCIDEAVLGDEVGDEGAFAAEDVDVGVMDASA